MSPLNEIRENILVKRNLGAALSSCKLLLVEKQEAGKGHLAVQLFQRLEELEQDYSLMRDYMLRGYEDDSREQVYIQLLRKTYCLWVDLSLAILLDKDNNVYAEAYRKSYQELSTDDIRGKLEGFVQDMAMSGLLDTEEDGERRKELSNKHDQFLTRLFNTLLSSFHWGQGDAEFYQQLLLSPTIENADACVLVSAVMLSCMRVFDVNKWMTMVYVYEHADDEHLRQRAFVGWVLSLSGWPTSIFPEYDDTIHRLTNVDSICQELLEMQKQMFFCMNVDREGEIIERDIMPTLLKNSRLNISRLGIEESEEDSMEEILNPNAREDETIEELEKAMNRMNEMQKSGGDIYFNGFSHMKRFPFFYTISHWFVPFSFEHPALGQLSQEILQLSFLKELLSKDCFCDSDKYSFAFSLPNVINKIPKEMRELLKSHEGGFAAMAPFDDIDHSPAYIRRLYLQDLLRFFRLYTRKDDFRNPFGSTTRAPRVFYLNSVFKGTSLSQTASSLCLFLYKHHWHQYIEPLMSMHVAEMSVEDLTIMGTLSLEQGKCDEALAYFSHAYTQTSNNRQVLRGLAKSHFQLGNYEEAEHFYAVLSRLSPDSIPIMLNHALSMIYCGRAEDSLKMLFKLQYEHPDNTGVLRMLAWNLLMQQRPSEASALYGKLIEEGEAQPVDYLNQGYALWGEGRVEDAVRSFASYKSSNESLLKDFEKDRDMLARYNKNDIDLLLMADIVEHFSN